MPQDRAVVLLSGGLDSTTAAAWAKANRFELFALTIDYNQRHRCELEAARRVGEFLHVSQHIFLDVNLAAFGGSSLTTDNLEVRHDVPLEEIGQEIPNTYVPARNTVFLSLALAYAETISAEHIILGINAADYSGYPDCRPEYLDAFATMARLATKAGVEGRMQLRFHAPLMTLGKREIIELGLSLGVDFSLTHTCYSPSPDGQSCGRCESCLLRRKGFQDAGVADPIGYALVLRGSQ
ncbi:MAG: 7-cyano-7-deazaguanine synthase QueC [Planctomycetaceae bacterium]|nr:7-cyano-7-deazaguanine synthase QueC [Planctomycetaceae bacterium]